MEFIEALRFLAERAGIELQRRRRPERTVQREDGTPGRRGFEPPPRPN
jgi:hypothetical protein